MVVTRANDSKVDLFWGDISKEEKKLLRKLDFFILVSRLTADQLTETELPDFLLL